VIALAAPMLGAGLLLGAELVSPDQPFGWLGAAPLAALGSFTLWRAGSVKAWKDTAEARYRRIGDLERELGGDPRRARDPRADRGDHPPNVGDRAAPGRGGTEAAGTLIRAARSAMA
jgi:hypothetical protein